VTEPRRVAGALIVDSAGRIFVTRRSPDRSLFPNCWDVVGGHVEPGETFEEAMRREVTEETGWAVTEIICEVGRYTYTGNDGVVRDEQEFLVRVDGDLGAPALLPEEHVDWRWITSSQTALLDESRLPGDVLLRRLVEDGFELIEQVDRST
jgi:8-oxo-dGTP diphosphatase